MSVKDYPEHLNPFGDNYLGADHEPEPRHKEKYNTWSASRAHKVALPLAKPKAHFLEKPWAALNISPRGKLVRRLSVLKQAVERFATKSQPERHVPRSHSVGEDYSFRIISPKLKEKLRQQAFNRELSDGNVAKTDTSTTEDARVEPTSPRLNGRLTPLRLDSGAGEQNTPGDLSPATPEPGAELTRLGARPKTRKKKPPPPPPPPVRTSKSPNLELRNGEERVEDNQSINSSITQDLERGVSSEEEGEEPDRVCRKD